MCADTDVMLFRRPATHTHPTTTRCGDGPHVWWTMNVDRHTTIDTEPRRTALLNQMMLRRWLLRISAGVLVVGAIAGVLMFNTPKTVWTSTENGVVFNEHQQSMTALAAGCGPEYAFKDPHAGTVVPSLLHGQQNRLQWRNIVPMDGPFWNTSIPVSHRVWSYTNVAVPAPESALNNEWHGAMVVYYDRALPASDVTVLDEWAAENQNLEAFVVPWTRATPIPAGRRVAISTWNATMTCYSVNPMVLTQWRDTHPAFLAPGYRH